MASEEFISQIREFRTMMHPSSIQIDVMAMLPIEKGLITKDEFYTKLKQTQMKYRSKDDD